ncbi:MAG: hypothetical protein WB564_04960 [Dehalococcoidia bacterium]
MKSLLNRAIDNLDTTLATLGCVLAIPLTLYLRSKSSPVYTALGVIVFLACLAYLLLRRRSPAFALAQAEATPRMYLLLNILFFCLLTYSIATFYLRPELYTRPLGYFIALSALAAILAIEILFLPSHKSAVYFALFKIIIVSLSLVWSQLLLYPSLVGVDPWGHQMFTMKILHAGHIPSGYDYSRLPGMHLLIGGTSLITGLDYKMAAMFSVSLSQVVCIILFIFLLGKFIHSAKAGLLAALSLGTANYFIWYSYWTVANTMGVVFIPIIIYLLFKLRQEKPKASICLSALFIALVILTHTISTVALVVILFSLWLGFELYKRLRYQAAERARIFLVAALVLTGAGLIYWTFVSGHIDDLIKLAKLFITKYLLILLPGIGPPPQELSPLEAAVAQYQNLIVPFSERLFNQLGFLLSSAFALIGAFALLSQRLRNRYGFSLVIAGFVTLIVTYIGIAADFYAAERFGYPLQILLAIPVGIAFLWLASLPGKKIASMCLIGILVFALSFLMVIASNQDNRTFSPNTIVRYAFAQSELQAANTASNIYDGKIAGDEFYNQLKYLPEPDGRIVDISDQLYSRNFTNCQDMLVLIRKEIVVNPLKISELSPFRLDYDPRQAFTEQGFSKVYDCGSVSGFVK